MTGTATTSRRLVVAASVGALVLAAVRARPASLCSRSGVGAVACGPLDGMLLATAAVLALVAGVALVAVVLRRRPGAGRPPAPRPTARPALPLALDPVAIATNVSFLRGSGVRAAEIEADWRALHSAGRVTDAQLRTALGALGPGRSRAA